MLCAENMHVIIKPASVISTLNIVHHTRIYFGIFEYFSVHFALSSSYFLKYLFSPVFTSYFYYPFICYSTHSLCIII